LPLELPILGGSRAAVDVEGNEKRGGERRRGGIIDVV
jgi:hypothetical protein